MPITAKAAAGKEYDSFFVKGIESFFWIFPNHLRVLFLCQICIYIFIQKRIALQQQPSVRGFY